MVPDKFNMVDMDGIDLIMMQGEEVPGLYDKLVESIAQCRYQCLYNWMFDGVIIPPTYVQMEINDNNEVAINEGVTVDEEDVVHIHSIEVIVDPVIQELNVTENGEYLIPEGVDGFNPVSVEVIPPLQQKTAIINGDVEPDDGYYGLSKVVVSVPSPPLQQKTVTSNGDVEPDSGYYGLSKVVVDVPSGSVPFEEAYIENLTGGYVSSGYWYKDPTAGQYTDVYKVDANKHYIALLSSVVGNRFRCSFTTRDVSTATGVISGNSIGTDQNDPEPYSSKIAFKPVSNGYINIFKTNTSQTTVKTYLLCLEKLF